jgi:hypothetical protein
LRNADFGLRIEREQPLPIRNPKSQIRNTSLSLDLMQRVPAQAGAELFQFHLLRAAGDFDFGAIVKIARLRALQPHVFTVFFCHDKS